MQANQLSVTSVLQKSELGRLEAQSRQLALPQRERALLIMIDGKRTVGQIFELLPDFVSTTQMLQSLLEKQLIEALTSASAISPTQAPDTKIQTNAPMTAENFNRLKLHASRSLEKILGPQGDRLCLLLEACKTKGEFDERLEKTIVMVAQIKTPSVAAGYKELVLGE
jgi:hypothetical protein